MHLAIVFLSNAGVKLLKYYFCIMKKLIITSGLLLLTLQGSFSAVYFQRPMYNYNNGFYSNPVTYRPNTTYSVYPNRYINNSYNPYYSPYNYRKINASNAQKLNRLRTIRRMNRQRNYLNNFLTWNIGKNNNGSMTGYSVPVTQDIYSQMGISPYDPKSKQKTNSPTCNTDLFSTPSGDEMYYKNGEKSVDLGGISGKTGVSIIYD